MITPEGYVYCWGSGIWGLVPVGEKEPCECVKEARQIPGLSNVRQLALGAFFSCALEVDGSVWCWGINEGGLGNIAEPAWDRSRHPAFAEPRRIAELPPFVAIAAGTRHLCGLGRDRKTVSCIGDNNAGQLGSPSGGPVPLEDAESVEQIVAGGNATCILSAGTVTCWGGFDNAKAPSIGDATPRRFPGLPAVFEIGVDGARFAAVTRGNAILSGGYGTAPDQLGFKSKSPDCLQGCFEPVTELPGLRVDALPDPR